MENTTGISPNKSQNMNKYSLIPIIALIPVISNSQICRKPGETAFPNNANASNIIHAISHGHYKFYLNNDENIIKALTISNFYGSLIDGVSSRIASKKGDAF